MYTILTCTSPYLVCFYWVFFLEMGDLFKKTSEHSFNINRSVLLLLCQSLERLKKKWNCEISSAGILVAQEAISIDITSVLGKKVV